MKKAFRSVLAFMLVFVIMASVFCTAGVFAAADTVYTAHLHGTGNTTLATEEVSVEPETTYTVSFLWKSVQGNARVRLSGSAVGSKNVDLIVDGSYPMPGINYNWQTGRVTYTFTASGDALFFSALQYSAEETEFYIGDVKIFASDANGVAVEGGEVIDLSFVNGDFTWTAPDAAYIDYAEQETGFFALESDPNDGVEKLIVFKMPYVFPDAWDARSFNKEVSVDTSKTYTFKMYYKSLSTDNNRGNIVVNNTIIVENGGYNVKNGAVYDGYTGLISYTFKPSNSSIYINMENRFDEAEKVHRLKDYAIAMPQLFESDENGNAVEGGDVVDCDTTFESWNYDGWNGHTTLYSAAGIELGSKDFFITKSAVHTQPENGKVYVGTFNEWFTESWVGYSVNVESGKTYTFGILYKYGRGDEVTLSLSGNAVGETVTLARNADTVSAEYDPYTGRYSYTFTAQGDTLNINLNTGTVNSQFIYWVADPILTDSEGGSVNCDVDFCQWTTDGLYGRHGYFSISDDGDASFFATKVRVHEQPGDGKVYVGTFNEWFVDGAVYHSIGVETGKTYTFSMLYKFITAEGENVQFTLSGSAVGEKVILANNADPVSAEYDPLTGRYSYTFTAQGDTLTINLQNSSKNVRTIYLIADPQMADSDGNSVNCDVDFCQWNTSGLYGRTGYFNITTDYASGFGVNLITGDANADGAFNIADLVAAKKYLSNARKWLSFKALNTTKADISADTLAAVRRWLLNGAEVLSKQEVMNKLTAAASSKYLLGAHTAGNTDVPACADSFSAVMGYTPGYIDVDMHSLPFISGDATNRIVSDVTAYAMQGTGFITLSAHWLTPTTKIADATLQGANNSRTMLTVEQYNNVMTAGTTENTNFLEELAIDAAFIRKLKDNGISVIFRSMHESNQGYFWWCVNPEQGITAAMYSNLYRYVHDYFTVTCGLDNIIWQFNADRAGYNAETVAAMYPGDNYVDTVSLDWYLSAGSTATELYNAYTSLMSISGNKPFAIAEFGGYGDYDIYNISFSETLKKIDDACTMGAKIAYVGPYVNWGDIKN